MSGDQRSQADGHSAWTTRAVMLGALVAGACDHRAPSPSTASAPSASPSSAPHAETFPSIERIGGAKLKCSPQNPNETLDPTQARRVFGAAKAIIDDPLDGWSYAPWCSGWLMVDGVERSVQLFLGGRGRLTLPAGSVLFEMDPTLLAGAI